MNSLLACKVLIAAFGAVLLDDGAGHQLPVLCFGKELSGAVYERAAGIIVVLQLKHHPCRRVAEIPVNTQQARKNGGGAVWRPLHIGVRWTNQGTLRLDDPSRHRTVIRGDGLQARCRGRLGRRGNENVRRAVDQEN